MFDLSKVVRKEVADHPREILRAYLDDRTSYLMLDKNENLHPMSDEQFEVFKSTLTPEKICQYPVLDGLYKKIAKLTGVKEEQVYIGHGSDVVIKSIFDACIEKGDHIVLHQPCYFQFENYAKYAGCDYTSVPVDTDWKPDVETMLAAVTDKTKMMVIEDPSGFVGTRLSHDDMALLARRLYEKNVLLLIDEAYLYVLHNTSENLDLINQYENVIITHTMSKAHALAGARVGYMLGNAEIIDMISRVRPLYEISALSAWAAEWQLDHPEQLANFQKTIADCKKYLISEFEQLDIQYKDSCGNFVLIKLTNENDHIVEAMFKELGILIRRPFVENQLVGWYRISITGMEESKQFAEALKIVVSHLA
ncbi:pyridoxal phosphate-dependent aminotransferase [Rheinheimera sp. WS51]|uniref:pyridoxal phosphate-dependent aminotransferase n=1 Tax=Rheinheimera sp. WS51 TaxID=3425886 RepID=UPI003D916B84